MYQTSVSVAGGQDAARDFLSANAMTALTTSNAKLVHAMTGILRLGLDVDVTYPLREIVELAAQSGENAADLLAAAEYAVVDDLMDLQADALHSKMRRLGGFVSDALRGVPKTVTQRPATAV